MEQIELIDLSGQRNQDKVAENSREEEKETMSDGEKEESEAKIEEVQKPQISRIEQEILMNLPESINEIKPIDVSDRWIICIQFKTLILDDFPLYEMQPLDKAYLEKFEQLTHLSLNNCRLKSLANFPPLPNLTQLFLGSNRLISRKETLLHTISKLYPNLTHIGVSNNFLSDKDSLQFMLRQPLCETLEWIDLSANPIRDQQPPTQPHGQASIQELLFEGISTLRVLDGRDRDGKEVFEGVEFEGEQPAQPEQKENPLLPKWMQESQR